VLEPNAALRSAIVTLLAAEEFEVQKLESLEEVLVAATETCDTVALVAWQTMQGLLAEEHRRHLVELNRRVRLVIMVPRHWARLLESTDLPECVTAMVAKPFQADELLSKLESALAQPIGLADGVYSN
jgi:FixJ family two-component response regulator